MRNRLLVDGVCLEQYGPDLPEWSLDYPWLACEYRDLGDEQREKNYNRALKEHGSVRWDRRDREWVPR